MTSADNLRAFKRDGRIVVVGASLAGLRAAEALRGEGFTGSLTMIGDEPSEPYDRPPLSKQVLTGWVPADGTLLPRRRDIDAEWLLGVPASGLDMRANQVRLAEFRRYLASRPADSLETLVADNSRFRNTAEAGSAYGEAWALTYYLLQRHRDAYHAYVKSLATRAPLDNDTAAARLAAFREAFGDDIAALDREMVRYIQQLR